MTWMNYEKILRHEKNAQKFAKYSQTKKSKQGNEGKTIKIKITEIVNEDRRFNKLR